MRALQAALAQGADALGLVLTETQQAQLLDYLVLLQKWGRVYNLTAVRDPQEMLTYHLLDSLAVIAVLRRQDSAGGGLAGLRLLDVGAGAGLPGVVVAICCPELTVCCMDAVAKKSAFVQQVAVSLGLPNLRAVHARVEDATGTYDLVVSRAFASLADFTRLSAHLLSPQGQWMALKGRSPDAEIAALPTSVDVFHVEQLLVPGLDAQRCLVWMRPRSMA